MIKPGAMLRVSEFAQGDEEIPESQGSGTRGEEALEVV